MTGESSVLNLFHFSAASETYVSPDCSSTSTRVRGTIISSSSDLFTLSAGSPTAEPRIASNNRSQNNNPLMRGMFGGILGGGTGFGLAAIFGNPLALLVIGLLLGLIIGLMLSGGIHNHGEEDAHEHSESVHGHIVQPPAEVHAPSPVVTPLPVATPPPAITPPVNDDEFTLPIEPPVAPPLQAPIRSRL